MQRSNALKKRRRPFQPAIRAGRGPRKPVEAMLEPSEGLRSQVIEGAKDGDMMALRLCFDGIVPPPRERPVGFAIPRVEALMTLEGAAIVEAVAGKLISSKTAELGKLVESYARAPEVSDLALRIERPEEVR
jgi:hypothetical protein